MQRQLQRALQLGADELAYVGREQAAGMEQVTAGRLRQMQHLVRLIHEQARRTDFLQQARMRLIHRPAWPGAPAATGRCCRTWVSSDGKEEAGAAAALVDVMALVHWPKELARTLRRLGAAQKQVTVLAQPIVERGEDHLLQLPLQVDQQVAADDQIEAREGRVVQQVVGGEEHPFAHLGLHLVVAVVDG